jgi:ribonuclease HII
LSTELFSELRDKQDNYSFERILSGRGYRCIAGCDEAGRGPLAGPVVAGAVVLPADCDHSRFRDSKQLSHRQRVSAYDYLTRLDARIGIGIVSSTTIDKINILQASLLAMRLAIEQLADPLPDFLLIDGKFSIPLDVAQQPLVKGESRSSSIAAASIVAKVERDRIMDELHAQFPQYKFARHKGYPTRQHRQLLREFGPSPVHRRSFRGVLGNDD